MECTIYRSLPVNRPFARFPYLFTQNYNDFVSSSHVTFISSYRIYDRNLAFHSSERLELIRVLGTDRRSVMMIRLKVNSKSEEVENREGKSVLYRCNLWL